MLIRLSGRLTATVLLAICVTACKEEGGVRVADFSFTGVKAVSEDQLRSVLATTESSKLPWGTKHYFSREQFEADLKRIIAFYKDRGYPDARVTSFDADLSDDQSSVRLKVNIMEGQPVTVERLALDGFQDLPQWARNRLDRQLPLKQGQPLDRALLQASREMALDTLKEHGHPYASVRAVETEGASAYQRVVALEARPGPLARFGDVEVSGNSSVSDDVVRRQLTFRPGQPYRQSRVIESQRKLYSLEVFDFVNVEPRIGEEQLAEIPTRVTVTEGKHRKVNFSLGYGSEEKARGEANWRHVNFFGGARTLGLTGRYSSLDSGMRLDFGEPYLFSPRYTLGVSGQVWHTDEPAFTLDTRGGRVTVNRQFARGRRRSVGQFGDIPTTLSLTYANEWESYSIANATLEDLSQRDELIALGLDPRTGTGRGLLSSLALDASRNTTDNLLNARRGYVASMHLEKAGSLFGGDFNYYELTAEGRYYQSIARRAVVAVRVRAGSLDGTSEEAVPFFKRYFLGGATNLRGWGRFDVSPLSGSGLPIGGQTTLNFSTELRVPVVGNLGAVLFLDGGNVWTNPWDFNLNDLRYDVGPGIRYNTPIGPLRVDVGYQLNPIPGLLVNGEPETRRFRVHFSIGQAF